MCMVRALLLLAYTKQTLPLIGFSKKWHSTGWANLNRLTAITYRNFRKACLEFSYKINQITSAISMFLALTGEDVKCQLKIRAASKNFKNQQRPLFRPSSVNFCQHFWNLSHKTVPLKKWFIQRSFLTTASRSSMEEGKSSVFVMLWTILVFVV